MFQCLNIKGNLLRTLGVPLFFSSVLAVCGYLSISQITEINEVEKVFNKVSTTLLQMRTAEKDFLMRDIKNEAFMESGTSKNVTAMSKLSAIQDSIINALLESKWSAKLEIQSDLILLQTNIKAYQKTFTKITQAYKKRGHNDFGDEGELQAAVGAIEQSDYAVGIVQLLTLRKIERDFFLHRDMHDVAKFTAEITAFIDKFDMSSKGQDIKIKIADYEAKFNDLVKREEMIGLNENLGLLGKMGSDIYKVESITEKLVKLISVRCEQLVSQTVLTLTIFFLVQLIMGFILALQVSNRRTSNIHFVRKTSIKLSEVTFPEHVEIKTQR